MNFQDNNQFDVAIVGAGMVGGAIAAGLAASGLSVAIIDQSLPPEFNAEAPPALRVSAISYASEQLLRNLGAWPFIEQMRLCCYRRLGVWEYSSGQLQQEKLNVDTFWQQRGLGKTLFHCDEAGKSHLGHIIENHVIQNALHQVIRQRDNIRLYCPARVEQFTKTTEGIGITLDNQDQFTCQLLIGADGANSKVRQWASIGQYREQYEQQAMVITVEYQGQQQNITWQAFTPSGPRAFLPLADQAGRHFASLVWYDSPQRLQALKQLDLNALQQQISCQFPALLPPIIQVIERGSFPLARSHAHHYAVDGVVLAGDAAHTINPLAGQGVNLGFQDAAELIEVIARQYLLGKPLHSGQLYRQYERIRRRQNTLMMNTMDVFYHGFSNNSAPLKFLRQLGLGLAHHAGPLKKQVLQRAIGLNDSMPKIARTQ